MNILHIGDNICGIPNAFKRAEIISGHDAKVVSFVPDSQGHISDYNFNEPSRFRRLLILLSIARSYETFIFTGDSLIWGLDILLWKLLGKKVAIHYHGSEARNKGLRFFQRFADAWFVATPDLLEYIPNAIWLPNPIFVEDYKQHYTIGTIIAHSPTNRELKGTRYLIEAVGNIIQQTRLVKLHLIEGVSHEQALESMRKATVVVDQLIIGWYGTVTLECMAMHVPVMCYIRDDLKKFIIDSGFAPIWYTSKETIRQDLTDVLFASMDSISDQTEEGYEYVKTVHNPKQCVELMMKALVG
jgi:hypothetical protein